MGAFVWDDDHFAVYEFQVKSRLLTANLVQRLELLRLKSPFGPLLF